MFQTAPEKALAELERQVAEQRAGGWRPSQEMLDLVEAQKVRVHEDNEARKAREARQKLLAYQEATRAAEAEAEAEAALKAEARTAYTLVGGLSADFDSAWPGLRAKIIEERTLAQLADAGSIIAKKRASGMYGL